MKNLICLSLVLLLTTHFIHAQVKVGFGVKGSASASTIKETGGGSTLYVWHYWYYRQSCYAAHRHR